MKIWDYYWEALERCRINEERLLKSGLPVQAAVSRRLSLIERMLALVIEWPKKGAQNLANRSAVEPLTARVRGEENGGEQNLKNLLSDPSAVLPVEELDRMTMLHTLFSHNWDALERCRITEEQLADRGLPVQAVMRPVVRLTRKMLEIVIELRRAEARQLLERDKGDREQLPDNFSMRGPRERITAENHLAAPLKERERAAMLWALCRRNWEAMDRCDMAKEHLANHGCRIYKLLPASMLLMDAVTGILSELRRNDAQAFFIRRVAGREDPSREPLSDAAKWALNGILKQFSPQDRSVLRRIWDRARPNEE